MSTSSPYDGSYLPCDAYLEALAGEPPAPASTLAEALKLASRVFAVVADYDVRNLSLVDLRRMCHRLLLAGGLDLTEYAVMTFRTEVAPVDIAVDWFEPYLATPQALRDWPAVWRARLDELIARRHVGPETRLTEQVWQLLNSFAEPAEDPLDEDPLDA